MGGPATFQIFGNPALFMKEWVINGFEISKI